MGKITIATWIISEAHYNGGGGQDCCHIVLFFKGPMFELQPCHYYEDSHNISHIMINQNPKKPNAQKKNIFNFIWCNVKLYFKKNHKLLKNVNILKNDWNDFYFLWNL